jgi:hypothetical protein
MVGMRRTGPVDLSGMDRRFFEALSPDARVELLCRLHALAIEQAEKLARDNSSRPPSSDGPFAPASGTSAGAEPPAPSPPAPDPPARSSPASSAAARGSGGARRCKPSAMRTITRHSAPPPFEMWDRQSGHSAHFVLDLERTASGSPAYGTAILRSSAPAVPPPVPVSACCRRCRGARATCC